VTCSRGGEKARVNFDAAIEGEDTDETVEIERERYTGGGEKGQSRISGKGEPRDCGDFGIVGSESWLRGEDGSREGTEVETEMGECPKGSFRCNSWFNEWGVVEDGRCSAIWRFRELGRGIATGDEVVIFNN